MTNDPRTEIDALATEKARLDRFNADVAAQNARAFAEMFGAT